MKNKIKALDFNELAEVEFKKGINALKLYDHENSISHLKKSVRFLKNTHNYLASILVFIIHIRK